MLNSNEVKMDAIEHEEIKRILEKYPKVYDQSPVQTITNAPVYHRIETGDALPVFIQRIRRSPAESKVLKEETEKMLEARVIRPSNSPWCSPPILALKPDGSLRVCINYKRLNSITQKDKLLYPT
ncbi:hypothetical protein CLU79DRAFT_841289 [Phycomyces nitens]|nr:hypothetical protein CLU79DRAFT_841289 [Phycomyces nitens]